WAAPRIYAPYQPRFDWDLWFASLDDVSEWPWVVTVEERLLEGEPAVLRLFAGDPFGGPRPVAVGGLNGAYLFNPPAGAAPARALRAAGAVICTRHEEEEPAPVSARRGRGGRSRLRGNAEVGPRAGRDAAAGRAGTDGDRHLGLWPAAGRHRPEGAA